MLPPEGLAQECTFKRLPLEFPIEGYDPGFYNNLPPATRAKAAYPEVVFPRNLDELLTKTGDELLSATDLYNLYRKTAFTAYEVVTADDLVLEDEEDLASSYFLSDDEEGPVVGEPEQEEDMDEDRREEDEARKMMMVS